MSTLRREGASSLLGPGPLWVPGSCIPRHSGAETSGAPASLPWLTPDRTEPTFTGGRGRGAAVSCGAPGQPVGRACAVCAGTGARGAAGWCRSRWKRLPDSSRLGARQQVRDVVVRCACPWPLFLPHRAGGTASARWPGCPAWARALVLVSGEAGPTGLTRQVEEAPVLVF